jgi:hypothetical protein
MKYIVLIPPEEFKLIRAMMVDDVFPSTFEAWRTDFEAHYARLKARGQSFEVVTVTATDFAFFCATANINNDAYALSMTAASIMNSTTADRNNRTLTAARAKIA